jgi:integrase
MVKRWGPLRVLNGVTRVKTIFKFAFEAGKLSRTPIYGQAFKPPSRSIIRRHRAKQTPKLFDADDIRAMIEGRLVVGASGPDLVRVGATMRAMILLGINAGFGNGDVAALEFSRVNLAGGWIDFPRPKTGIARRCPLWPETVEAIRAATAEGVRPKPATFAECGLVFLTYRGTAWVRQGEGTRSDYVSQNFNKLLKRLGIDKAGVGFYGLRHTFRTVADGSRDNPAVRFIMGHDDASIDAAYRERIEDERLRAVAGVVRKWLFGEDVT